MSEQSLDALVVTALPNIAYLTNFAGSSAVAVITADQVFFVTDSRYSAVVTGMSSTAHACPGLELALVSGSYDSTLASVLERTGGPRVGVEGAHLSVSRFNWLSSVLKGPGIELVPVDGMIERLRRVKDDYEVGVFRTAGAMLSAVTMKVLGLPRAGMEERDLALEIDTLIRREGFEKTAFDTIVASGPNAGLPHARPSRRILSEGDLVVLDFGGVYDSYCVDLTRTVVVGQPSDRARQLHSAVRQAQAQAIDAVRPGVSRFDVDRAAREVLAQAGFGPAFGHGTGHGLGLEIHEDPRVTERRPNVDASFEELSPGTVFTIEPGAYFPEWGGVRIEDDVLVTESGVEMLTHAPTELISV